MLKGYDFLCRRYDLPTVPCNRIVMEFTEPESRLEVSRGWEMGLGEVVTCLYSFGNHGNS